MRRIDVDLPDWCDERHIYVMAGMELAAYQRVGEPMKVKVSRCSQCGKCCQKMGCEHLEPDGDKWRCGLAINRPFACCISVGSEVIGACTERFE